MPAALQYTQLPWYVVSDSASSEEITACIKETTTLDLPPPRVYGSEQGKKHALQEILSRPLAQDPENTVNFFDADVDFLRTIAGEPLSQSLSLFYAPWTGGEEKLPKGVTSMDLETFVEFITWGRSQLQPQLDACTPPSGDQQMSCATCNCHPKAPLVFGLPLCYRSSHGCV